MPSATLSHWVVENPLDDAGPDHAHDDEPEEPEKVAYVARLGVARHRSRLSEGEQYVDGDRVSIYCR
jgi:hypothetical protein